MNQSNQYNRFLIASLLIISVVVWGIIIYRIVKGENFSFPSYYSADFSKRLSTEYNFKEKTILDSIQINLKTKIRNPFQPMMSKNKIEKKKRLYKKKTPIFKIIEPDFRLVGILISYNSKNKAIFDLGDGNTVICSEGDSVKGFRINYILEEHVEVMFKSKIFRLDISQN